MRINPDTINAIIREGCPPNGMTPTRAAAAMDKIGTFAGFTSERFRFIRKRISNNDHIEPREAEKLAFGLARFVRRAVTLDEIQAEPRNAYQDTSTKQTQLPEDEKCSIE